MDTHSFNVLSLCTGGGGLDRGVHLAVPTARVVCCVEHEAFAAEILASQMENGYLDDAPIWTDLRTFDGKPWRGVVDCVIAGIPCQPFSAAGKRAGADDHRELSDEFLRIIAEVEPEYLLLENVPGLITTLTIEHRPDLIGHLCELDSAIEAEKSIYLRWHAEKHRERLAGRWLREHGVSKLLVLRAQLEELGYRVEAGLFSAEEVGAPHKRERLFIMGCREGFAGSLHTRQREPRERENCFAGASRTVGDSTSVRLGGAGEDTGEDRSDGRRLQEPERGSGSLADAGIGLVQVAERGQEGRNGARPNFPPPPRDREGWMRLLKTDPSLEPAVCVCSDGMADRANQLRLLGNGVVPLAAGYAFLSLFACLRGGE